MSDRIIFIKNILLKPDDDQVRLIFADYLEEYQEKPQDEAWAHLIRYQIEIAQLADHAPDGEDPEGSDCSICKRLSHLNDQVALMSTQLEGYHPLSLAMEVDPEHGLHYERGMPVVQCLYDMMGAVVTTIVGELAGGESQHTTWMLDANWLKSAIQAAITEGTSFRLSGFSPNFESTNEIWGWLKESPTAPLVESSYTIPRIIWKEMKSGLKTKPTLRSWKLYETWLEAVIEFNHATNRVILREGGIK